MFKRKAMKELIEWKNNFAPKYAALLEGARRVGKSTIAEEFAKQNYKSYIKIDFGQIDNVLLDVFNDITNLDLFFLRLQNITGTRLYERKSVVIFDEIQLNPPVRQAIKHLVADGRYDYIETGSLISIKKNVKNILIPSEEYKINIYPFDYEEFLWATSEDTYDLIRESYRQNIELGNATNRKLMRDFRIYMAIGGMPQAIQAYVDGKDFATIDRIKRSIIDLYIEDFKKIDPSGLIGKMFKSIPSQLASNKKRYVISNATNKRKTDKDLQRLAELIDSKTVLPCYNVTNPNVTLSQSKTDDNFKLYLLDVGLFTTMIFDSSPTTGDNIYNKLLGDKLPANLGYLYENVVAQMIACTNTELYYHTWKKLDSTHHYEIDFLLRYDTKIIPFEVKSADNCMHESIKEFCVKYNRYTSNAYVLSQKDVKTEGKLLYKPIYMLPFILEEIV
ncbi:MAG: AAA family ATPase [Clostridia bacterium]|nr:AAA family ATPase [Clostridia bacterium]